jgi:hypothetical protein
VKGDINVVDAFRDRMIHHREGLGLVDFAAESGGAQSDFCSSEISVRKK